MAPSFAVRVVMYPYGNWSPKQYIHIYTGILYLCVIWVCLLLLTRCLTNAMFLNDVRHDVRLYGLDMFDKIESLFKLCVISKIRFKSSVRTNMFDKTNEQRTTVCQRLVLCFCPTKRHMCSTNVSIQFKKHVRQTLSYV